MKNTDPLCAKIRSESDVVTGPAVLNNGYRIVSSYSVPLPESTQRDGSSAPLGIAVDIGTTTLAMELIDSLRGAVLSSVSLLNSQRRWGSDVISRIRAANAGNNMALRKAIHADVIDGVMRLARAAGVDGNRITRLVVSANTTMAHLFLGLSCSGMGQAPFLPEKTEYPELSFYDLFDCVPDSALPSSECTVAVIPSLSAFIGGDIVGGVSLLDCCPPSPEHGAVRLFLDLGTNAEMVLTRDKRHYCASAAAGPAFEGGSISCGTGCIAGAVSSVRLEGNRFAYERIPGGRPDTLAGICGSGIIDFTACALESTLIRQDGSLAPVCADRGVRLDPAGQIHLTQQDVREIQLAKGAVRAGISVLLETAGVDEHSVSSVVLAGGFGLYLNEESALGIGLLPPSFAGKIMVPGNTSLAAAAAGVLNDMMVDRWKEFTAAAETVVLADYPGFENLFISAMNF